MIADKAYLGLDKLGFNALIPFKQPKNRVLEPEQKAFNRELNRRRIVIEHVFAVLKAFKILGTRYRNRRGRLMLRFNLIAGIYNWQLIKN